MHHSLGLAFAHRSLALLQSKSTTPTPAVVLGCWRPLWLHAITMVDAFIAQVACHSGVVQDPAAATAANTRPRIVEMLLQ